MTPWDYALRYLPVQIPGPGTPYSIHISRYHLGAPTDAKDQLLGAVHDHFRSKQRGDPGYRLPVIVNGQKAELSYQETTSTMNKPFWGKGSPEDCQIVLQLALSLGGKVAAQLQGWANANLGLDCNGFVGNYLFHDVLGNDWRVQPGKTDVEPSSTIDEYFNRWAEAPLEDLGKVVPGRMHLIVRVDDFGHVIPQFFGTTVGHIAITQPNEVMQQSFVTNTMGFYDIETANLGMYGKLALRTVESGGPVTGVQKNWMVFVRSAGLKGVFEVRRDHIHMLDRVRIAPLRNRPS